MPSISCFIDREPQKRVLCPLLPDSKAWKRPGHTSVPKPHLPSWGNKSLSHWCVLEPSILWFAIILLLQRFQIKPRFLIKAHEMVPAFSSPAQSLTLLCLHSPANLPSKTKHGSLTHHLPSQEPQRILLLRHQWHLKPGMLPLTPHQGPDTLHSTAPVYPNTSQICEEIISCFGYIPIQDDRSLDSRAVFLIPNLMT